MLSVHFPDFAVGLMLRYDIQVRDKRLFGSEGKNQLRI